MTAIVKVSSKDELEAAYDIRVKVFHEEQGYGLEEEFDDIDGIATHLIALHPTSALLARLPATPPPRKLPVIAARPEDTVVGTVRVWVVDADGGKLGRLGRLAVVNEARGLKLGVGLVKEGEEAVRALGGTRMELHAQVPKRGFYDKLGYTAVGEEYLEDGTPHINMVKTL
ncbi:hypothetical protein HDU96_009187 [Phlyctochytrium bullatum]|nr:hypothetical protein HDU96_009187 [Phlyctochytrium bullatum]